MPNTTTKVKKFFKNKSLVKPKKKGKKKQKTKEENEKSCPVAVPIQKKKVK